MKKQIKSKLKESKLLKEQNAITLIALVITIIVLLILAGVSIVTLTGDSGILKQANNSKLSTELSNYKEQLDLYKQSKYIENNNFVEETLTAGKTNLSYNTQIEGETGNIKTIIKDISDEYFEKIEVLKGKLLINTKDRNEIKIAQSLGIEVNPYEITEDGVLVSSDGNLLLMDEKTGTLTIPDTVKEIGEGAFANLDGLKTVIIPSSVKRIEQNAFSNNKTLEIVIMQEKEKKDGTIEGVEYIGHSAFQGCTNLTTVQMANSVKEVGIQVFYNNTKLQNINISKNLTIINRYMFAQCTNLIELEFPKGVAEFSSYAFVNCTSLKKIKLPNTLERIDGTVFGGCKNLKDINLSENTNFKFENGILLGQNETEIVLILEDAIKNNTLSIPNTVTSLRTGQISKIPQITTLNIPASVKIIESGIFSGSNITNVKIDDNNPKYEIYANAIYTKESTDEDIKIVGYFGNEDVVLVKEGTKIIESMCFSGKTNLKKIDLPQSLKTVGSQAFYGCMNLKSIKLGPNVNNFDNMSIYNSGIEEIIISEDNPNYSIRYGAICNGENAKALYNKNGSIFISPIKLIGEIKTYEIPSKIDDIKVTEIAGYAFHNQNKMTNIIIPNTIEKIRISFNYCNALKNIEIPNSVKEINFNCFANDLNLTEIRIHNKKGSILGSPWGCIYGERAIIWDE